MKYVYILESLDSEHFVIGIADDLRARLAKHTAGEVPHTSKYRPCGLRPTSPSATNKRPSISKSI
jgi:predicted GIY-YIG superfamily endonuclease